MSQREPISELLKQDHISEKTKGKLILAMDAKKFAENQLKLTPTNNYNSFVQLNRPYVTYIVRVAKANELEAENFWFPIVGSVPYKGFFSEIEAQEEALSFDSTTYDTYVRGASAYSTLGWFDDPMLSSMITYSDPQLVNLIIHETVHATIFIDDHVDFNERLATFIGNIGTKKYYLQKEGADSPTIKQINDAQGDENKFSLFITKEIEALKTWYKQQNTISPQQKQQRLAEIQSRFKFEVQPRLKVYSYKSFTEKPLNNAKILSLATYVQDLSDFQKLYDQLNQDLEKFLKFCKNLEDSKDPVAAIKKELL